MLILRQQLEIQLQSKLYIVPPENSVPDSCSARRKWTTVFPANYHGGVAQKGCNDVRAEAITEDLL